MKKNLKEKPQLTADKKILEKKKIDLQLKQYERVVTLLSLTIL